ncbi:hypothetical protein [Methanopyrus sp.]
MVNARIRVDRTTSFDAENGSRSYIIKVTVELKTEDYDEARQLNERLEGFIDELKTVIKSELLGKDLGKRELIL